MSKFCFYRKMATVTLMALVALSLTGCDCSKKLETAQEQNRMLTQQVAELQAQLEQASANAASSTANMGRKVYLVVEGDSLWSIAKKQLGSGTRYKEIQALNPELGENQPLTIGMELILPAE